MMASRLQFFKTTTKPLSLEIKKKKIEMPPGEARTDGDFPVQSVLQSFPVTKYGNDFRPFLQF